MLRNISIIAVALSIAIALLWATPTSPTNSIDRKAAESKKFDPRWSE